MAAEETHKAMATVAEAERIRAPLEYPEHDDLSPEDPLISESTTTDYITGREVKDLPKEREEDHHAYFVVVYQGGYEVTSSGLSDGTLRILALTILPYLPAPQLCL